MKICCISDMHGHLPDLSTLEFDILVIAGDFVPGYMHKGIGCSIWLNTTFRKWLEKVNKPIFAIAGNHEIIFEKEKHLVPKDLPWTYLENTNAIFNDFKIHGGPQSPVFFDWAFNAPEKKLMEYWKLIPDDTNILITHGPPRGFGDLTTEGDNVGSYTLLNRITQLTQLKAHIFGHIHVGYGMYNLNSVLLVNCAQVDEQYKPTNKPIIIEI